MPSDCLAWRSVYNLITGRKADDAHANVETIGRRCGMSSPTTVAEIVARIAAAHQRFDQTIASLSDAQLQEPWLPDGWSVKDVLAHVTFWDQRLLHAIAPDGGPNAFRLAPPLIADIPYNEHWTDRVNERIYQLNRERDLGAIKTELEQTRQRLRRVVGGLSEHDVFDADGLSAAIGIPFLPMLTGAYEHYEEHTQELEALLKR